MITFQHVNKHHKPVIHCSFFNTHKIQYSMLAEPIFQFTEELSVSKQSCAAATQNSTGGDVTMSGNGQSGRIIPPLRASLKRPSKLELKINLNEQQTESMSPMNGTPMSVHLQQQSSVAQSNHASATNLNNSHSHDKNNNFLNTKQK